MIREKEGPEAGEMSAQLRRWSAPSRAISVPAVILVWLTFSFLIADGSWPTKPHMEDRSVAELQVMAQGGPPSRQGILLLLGTVGLLGLARCRTARLPRFGLLTLCCVSFLIWAAGSVAWTGDPILTLRKVILLSMVIAPSLWLASEYPGKMIPQFVISVTSSGMLLGLAGEVIVGAFQPSAPGYRFAGMLSANLAGIHCALLVLAAVCLKSSAHTLTRNWTPLIVIGIVCLLLTRSRTAFIALVVALGVLWSVRHFHRRLKLVLASASISVLLIVGLTGASNVTSDLTSLALLGRDDSTVSTLTGRIPLWDVLRDYAAIKPLQGYGYSSFWTLPRIDTISKSQGWAVAEAHSTYLDLLLGVGWVGVVLFIIMMAVAIYKSIQLWRVSRHPGAMFCLAVFVFCLVDSLTESALAVTSTFQFVFIWCLVWTATQGRGGSNMLPRPV